MLCNLVLTIFLISLQSRAESYDTFETLHLEKENEIYKTDSFENRPEKFLTESHSKKHPHRSGKCGCEHKNCACCEHLSIHEIHLNDIVCANVTYIAEDIGMRVSMSVDSHVFYSREISIRDPPPVCFEVPHLRHYASLCIVLYNMKPESKDLSGCLKIEATLYHVRVARKKIGCFKIPI